MNPLRKIPSHLVKPILIAGIMILAFITFSTIIEISKETSKELTKKETGSG
ncbi:MAG: hypothetical protein KDJ26_00035 [Alphaproteobacteria bacterium]|jgi:hypothetical protein|nr:hypothetical protein [Alphaproteobacteria bacterium]MCB9985264.1 hypothetical protein [Micavibrio sp.]HPQ51419.1 hypothetical protein [Alphaproteobacteria bacterium]HRK98237.1 hypothetical protein [Alphaproteobacteria bacterium]